MTHKQRSTTKKTFRVENLEKRELLAGDTSVAAVDATLPAEVAPSEPPVVAERQDQNRPGNDDATLRARTDVVLEWNDFLGDIMVDNLEYQNPGYASRSMAMMNVAIYDAVTLAGGDANDTFYNYDADIVAPTARGDVAATQAAYTVLSEIYPQQQAELDAFRDSSLKGIPRNRQFAQSINLGSAVGNQVIAARGNDGSGAIVEYTYTDAIGNFQADPLNPDVPVWGPGWGEVDTFSISSVESFVPPTTPAITSVEYATSYNEVKELGSVDSPSRTADQTEAGLFWAYDREGMGTPLSIYSNVIETIAIQEGNTLEENAALFAQTSVAMADAAIVAWTTKFGEEFWRPVTAIQAGDADDNPLTEGDGDWTALGAPDGGDDIIGFTPQFPTYISGHATFGGALFGSLQEFYGTDDIAFELTSKELEIIMENPDLEEAYGLDLDDAERSFSSLSEAMAENGRSRVYLGIHFDFDDLVGQDVGQALATSVSSDFTIPSDIGGGPDRIPGGGGPGLDDGPRRGPGRTGGPAGGPGQGGPDEADGQGGGPLVAALTTPLDNDTTDTEDDDASQSTLADNIRPQQPVAESDRPRRREARRAEPQQEQDQESQRRNRGLAQGPNFVRLANVDAAFADIGNVA